jgi:hypothetical protein
MHDDIDIPLPAMSPGGTSAASYRVPRAREGMDPNTRRMLMIAGGIVGAFVVLTGVYSFVGHRRSGVPVVEPDARPLRVKPTDVGGMKVDGADDAILSGQGDGKAALSPPTEVPAPQALKATATPDAAPTTVASAPPAPVAPMPAPVAAPAVESQAATPAPVAVMPRAAPARPAAKPPVMAARPVAPPEAPTAASVIRPVMPPAQAHVAAAAAAAPAHPAAAHGPLVQLAAVGSEQAAQAEWQRLVKKMPDLLGGHTPVISKYEHDGKTFWRLRTGGFADPAAAKAFCGRMTGKGGGCAVIGA